MKPSQKALYFREWGKAWRAHWSGVVAGEPVARADRPASAMRERVLQAARMLALRDGSQLTTDLLRHGCHVVALGKDCGSWSLRNQELDRVLAVFRLLASESNLKAAVALEDPSQGTRERLLYSIRKSDLGPAYVSTVSRDKFGTPQFSGLTTKQLTELLMTLKARALARGVAQLKTSAAPAQ